MMSSNSFKSPNAIPPRTSSNGLNNNFHAALQPVLRPVPEGDWIAQGKKLHTTSTSLKPLGPDSPKNMGDDIRNGEETTWTTEKENVLLGPYEYLDGQPGKDIRKQLISAFNTWLKVPEKSLDIITKVVSMLHTASLLVDDVEDSSLLRRGVPVAHMIFGTAQTLNSANYVYFCALRELFKLNNPKALQVYADELCNLHRGQGMDLFWRDTLTCPSEDDYLEMVSNKTGGLFRLAVKLMQAESHGNKDFVPLVNVIGLIFQIRDDYMNLSSTDYTNNKGLCEDLTEGKFSFPVIHSIRSNPQNLQLINILKQKTNEEQVKRYAVSYMESTGSFAYCRTTLKELTEKAMHLIDLVDDGNGEGTGVRLILNKMAIE